jgi:hypothetical protein
MANSAVLYSYFKDVNCYTVKRDKEYKMQILEVAQLITVYIVLISMPAYITALTRIVNPTYILPKGYYLES